MVKLALIVLAGGFSLLLPVRADLDRAASPCTGFWGFCPGASEDLRRRGARARTGRPFLSACRWRRGNDLELLLELLDSLALISMATPHVFLSLGASDLDGKVNAAILKECDFGFSPKPRAKAPRSTSPGRR